MADDLDEQTLHLLRKSFAVADKARSGFIEAGVLRDTLSSAGITVGQELLDQAFKELRITDGKIDFDSYVMIAATFSEEDDEATIVGELREAFRLYDKEGNGYISTNVLREILKELDSKISDADMDGIIQDVDEDGKGRIDFARFKALMI